MVDNQEIIETEEYKNLSYSELSELVRKKAKITGRNFIPILYRKLLKERKKPEEAKLILEHDFKDIWAVSYINQFIPIEAKDEKKIKAAKEKNRIKKEILQIAGTDDVEVTYKDSAKLLDAENRSVSKKESNSASFQKPVEQEVIVELSSEECREIKSNSILRGRKFRYSLDKKKVVKWF
jgi:hypothetical protein